MAFMPKSRHFHYQDLVLDNERITWITTDSSARGDINICRGVDKVDEGDEDRVVHVHQDVAL